MLYDNVKDITGMELVQRCYDEAINLLFSTSTSVGFSASLGGLYGNEVWGRDGSITCLGAVTTRDNKLIESSRKTLTTFKQAQNTFGQIPNMIRISPRSINFYALDASSWWIIAVTSFWKATRDEDFLSEFWPVVKKAIVWLKYQDIANTGLVCSPPSADWMDSSLQRYGIVLYNNILYYKALLCVSEIAQAMGCNETESGEAERVKTKINTLFWPETRMPPEEWVPGWSTRFYEEAIDRDRSHYLNFLSFENYDWRCDVSGNCLAILWDVADRSKADRILAYILERRLASPFPIRVLDPPILYPNPSWNPKIDLYRPGLQQNLPYQYHNAGIWPWVGGLYILALEKVGKHDLALNELERLAQANRIGRDKEWEFNEWLHGKTGIPLGTGLQSWSASSYILACRAVLDHIWSI